ncbi:hypothetical protein AMAG_00888 [Allomyces macrogynus ATCC 38327]|uniref:PH domain-containing protein n=1 Tax=Allomyces macrogynus (strain ATCC 38327) TaxID=578462 RepID=A0A0L0RX29_ALLM3|nr:hypothetical protein AMAG_00888 [Allomyces macrogynus ATCC 38327]|eukprot:KNE54947.1 hypothetical protein AMAG_00888 [Allomyces macrogynus ATCC 38327]
MPATPSTISTSASMTTALTTVPSPAPGSAAALDDTVQSFRLLEALRTGDLATLKALPVPLTLHADLRAKFGSPLHLAVAMAPLRVVDWMLTTATPAQINAAHPFSGETPLHVAARAARLDVVERLLALPCINDGARDANGSRALDVARVDTVRQVLADAQAEFVATATARMHALARGDTDAITGTSSADDGAARASGSAEALPDVIGSDRDSVHSRADPTSVAALASASSATLLPTESINKPALLAALQQLFRDPRAAALLDINHRDPSSGATVLHEAARRGDAAMVKWLLTDRRADPLVRDRKGKFFYEISKDDHIKALFKEFVRSTPLTTAAPDQLPQHQGSLLKWTNYASGYKARWFVLEDGILSYYKHQDDVPNACRGSIHLKIASLWLDTSDHHRFDIIGKGSVRYHLRADHVVEAKRWVHVISQSKRLLQDQDKDARRRRQQSGAAVPASAIAPETAVALEATPSTEALPVPETADAVSLPSLGLPHAVSASDSLAPPTTGVPLPRNRSGSVASLGILDDDAPMPARETLTMTVYALHAQLDLQAAVIAGLVTAATNAGGDADALAKTVTSTVPVLNMAAATLHNLVDDLARLADDRDRHWQRRFDAESERKTVYEEALANLAREYQTVEAEARDMADTLRRTQRHMMRQRTVTGMTITPARVAEQSAAAESSTAAMVVAPESPDEEEQERAAAAEQVVATVLPEAVAADTTEDDDDEFFDAVDEEDEAHVAALTASITSPAPAPAEPAALEPATATDETALSLPGYEDETYSFVASLRDNLPVDHALLKNEVSLWSVLKNAIGKDLSRITLPVYFNEPISMLQRLCEEIEYSQLLDLAWKRDRSDERLLLVTAFAMSSYASTVGRAGKPFNPLLGETYEYVRKDRGFRYVSEQVSHHPPISACFCESDRYQFYGEVNVKNRFWGKSLEVMPQGVCHVVLKRGHVGEQDEHFTWRKVTTSVNNLIVGTLWLDNYGDLEMVNHATKEKVVLTFKPTGWRNKDRCVVEGKLFDASGKATWSLWGTWDEKLCCKSLTGDGRTFSLSNPNAGAAAAAAAQQRAIFNSPISASNFHLTPFAMSLNQMTPSLAQHLCPTDSRLRPDQRAMEEGRYDDAAFEKNRLEEKQRAARKVREQSGAGHAQPRWFVRDYDPDSRDEYWRFTHEYWACRAKGEWPGVPDIF